jgi:hypothetical protein
MEYYDYNSNQQKMQEEHNKRELYKLKESIHNWHNSENISLFINNVLIHIDFIPNSIYIHKPFFYNEFKNNIKEEISENIYNNKIITFKLYLDYFSKILNKQISNYVCLDYEKEDFYSRIDFCRQDLEQVLATYFFEKEFMTDILLFLYDSIDFEFNGFIIDKLDSYDYRTLIEDYNIKTLSEKRRMKSILENF